MRFHRVEKSGSLVTWSSSFDFTVGRQSYCTRLRSDDCARHEVIQTPLEQMLRKPSLELFFCTRVQARTLRYAAGRTFWFMRKKLLESYLRLSAASRS